MRLRPFVGRTFGAFVAVGFLLNAASLQAHPHNLVTVETTVGISDGKIKALQHTWTFGEHHSATALKGLDKNGDGLYSTAELAGLAKVYLAELKASQYFTVAKLGAEPVPLGAPTDASMIHKDGKLSLHFTLPLTNPVAISKDGFNFAIYDPGYFTAFAFARNKPIRLSQGATKTCRATISDNSADAAAKHASGFPRGAEANIGGTLAHTVSVTCSAKK